jgi:hypothetical protein
MPDVDLDLLIELDRALSSEGVHLRDFAAEHGVQYRLVSSLVADLGRRGYATEIWQDSCGRRGLPALVSEATGSGIQRCSRGVPVSDVLNRGLATRSAAGDHQATSVLFNRRTAPAQLQMR